MQVSRSTYTMSVTCLLQEQAIRQDDGQELLTPGLELHRLGV